MTPAGASQPRRSGAAQYDLMIGMLGRIRAAMDALYKEIGCDLADMAVKADRALKDRPLIERIRD
ncbi:hypothetical protein V0U79_08330 [Hyphobacterium sp. HN65]|uniref:Uncharacterized protein n=1 Tax=Hyphobacterium lacteum TaxID=3116575 RepID=A0ABU7LR38_9PROT|nr:hypothetical protein [Hyphobacterium sp. HN65]MEE2526371.1 hypothetical protein [Hyphobacterium sp. HN65]